MVNLTARPWEPQDLLDDLQLLIDEQPNSITNGVRTTLCTAKAYLEEYFAEKKKREVGCSGCNGGFGDNTLEFSRLGYKNCPYCGRELDVTVPAGKT